MRKLIVHSDGFGGAGTVILDDTHGIYQCYVSANVGWHSVHVDVMQGVAWENDGGILKERDLKR